MSTKHTPWYSGSSARAAASPISLTTGSRIVWLIAGAPVMPDRLPGGMPDAVRRPLEPLLPEIPLKARIFEEEHYLFAQLLASSPAVTLLWQVADDDGRARSESPFVARLRGAGVLPDPQPVVGPYAAGYAPAMADRDLDMPSAHIRCATE